MDEKLLKFLNITSIPAILVVFYMELKAIDNHIEQIEKLRNSFDKLEESIHDCKLLAHMHDQTKPVR